MNTGTFPLMNQGKESKLIVEWEINSISFGIEAK
jgi:hypothetical protein